MGDLPIRMSRIDEDFGGDPVAEGTSDRQRWHQKVLAELIFGQALSLFFGNGGGLLWQDLTWFCIRRQGRSVGGGGLSCDSSDQLEGAREVGRMLLLHYSGKALLAGFPMRARLFSHRARLGFV